MFQPPTAPGADASPELDVDVFTVPGQLYAVLSFVGPSGTNQKNDRFGLKVRGCFATPEEAASHVRRLQSVDKTMDIFVADMYKWLLIPPDVNAIENQEYQESYLNDMLKGYRDNQQMAKAFFEERKEAVRREGLDKHLLPEERIPAPPDGVDTSMFETDDPLIARRRAETGDPGAGPSDAGPSDAGPSGAGQPAAEGSE